MFIIYQKQQKTRRKAPYILTSKAWCFTALVGKRLEKNGEIQLYSKPGPAKGIITKMKKSDYYRSGKAGFVADNLEVVPIMLVPKY